MRFLAALAAVVAWAACAAGAPARGPAPAPPPPPAEGPGNLPEFQVVRWLNSEPLTPAQLRGKVVLVDFWEYTCVNCIRTLPFVKAWHRAYAAHGLVVIGVHAPEFEFGKEVENVDRGVRELGLTYPIALDNDFATWDAYENRSWPAKYLFDADGVLRGRWVGEGRYDQVEAAIRALLPDQRALPPVTREVREWNADYAARRKLTPETYLGTARRTEGSFTLEGDWVSAREYVEHRGGERGRLTMRVAAGEVNLVAAPGASGRATVRVRLDGHHVDDVKIDRSGMFRLLAGAPLESHELVLETKDDGIRMYAFTFGP